MLALKVGVMLAGQVPTPYTYTGVRTLLAQASPVLYSGRAKQRHLAHAGACNGDKQAVRAALGDAMSLNVLMRVFGKALVSASLLDHVPFRSVAANGQGHVAL